MGDNFLSKDAEGSSFAFWKHCIYVLVVSALGFFLISLLFFFLFHVLRSGLSVETFKSSGLSSLNLINFPAYVINEYQDWFTEFKIGVNGENLNKFLLIPLLGIVFSVSFVFYILFSGHSKKTNNNYFASLEDIERLGVLGRGAMLFGRLSNAVLKSKGNDSALVWFGKSLGKTTAVAIPTILDADDANIIAVDCSGILPKFTSGYRAQVGKVFNFNWDKIDNPEKGEYYPRWNPLSQGNMPKNQNARNNYIKFISQYLVIKDPNNYWEKLAGNTLEGLIHFFVCKVEQSMANDYFLTRIIEEQKLSEEDKNLLLGYYGYMPHEFSEEAILNTEQGLLNFNNYMPIGSWYNIPELWQGRDLSFAMIVDTLVHRYCSVGNNEDGSTVAVWKNMLDEFLNEAVLFGYNPLIVNAFEYLNSLSKKQRWVVFGIILDALAMFRNPSIRERTSLSDFNLHDIRGIKNPETGKKEVITVYSGAYTRDSAFMTSFFIDMLLGANLQSKNSNSQVLFILDDFELMPRLKLLDDLLEAKDEANISTMFLTNEIEDLSEIYNRDMLENVIKKTTYKLISAENNDDVVQKLGQISVYDSKANQINMKSGIDYVANPRMAFKSQAYHNLSKDLLSPQLKGAFTKGKYLLLVDGFYNLPIKAESIFFAKNENLKNKAALREIDDVNEIVLHNRHHQDSEVPDIIEVIKNAGAKISSREDLDRYIEKQNNLLTENISKIKDRNSHKKGAVSDKWKNTKKQTLEKMKIEDMGEENSWWLGEGAFSAPEIKKDNPFG